MNHLDLYLDDTSNKEIVIVGGGAVGLDIAEYFANRGASPTIIEMMNQIGRDLDPVTKSQTKEMMETIHFVRDEFDMTVLLIEHDMKLVSGICEELTVLNFGQVLAQGKTSDVLNDPQVIKAYLGE